MNKPLIITGAGIAAWLLWPKRSEAKSQSESGVAGNVMTIEQAQREDLFQGQDFEVPPEQIVLGGTLGLSPIPPMGQAPDVRPGIPPEWGNLNDPTPGFYYQIKKGDTPVDVYNAALKKVGITKDRQWYYDMARYAPVNSTRFATYDRKSTSAGFYIEEKQGYVKPDTDLAFLPTHAPIVGNQIPAAQSVKSRNFYVYLLADHSSGRSAGWYDPVKQFGSAAGIVPPWMGTIWLTGRGPYGNSYGVIWLPHAEPTTGALFPS